MNKKEIIKKIADDHGLSSVKATAIFNQIFDDITAAFMSSKNNNKIQIPGFGSFEMKKREARVGRNPQTGEAVNIPAKQVVKFTSSKTLKDKIN